MSATPSPAAKYVGEFVGTYMLVLTVGCNVLTGSPVWGVTSIACTLMVMIYALGNVSGANFNPAVSLALLLTGNMEMPEALKYMACQVAGGILAGFSYSLAFWETFNLQPTAGFSLWQAGLAEIIYTFMLCFVVLNVAVADNTEEKPNQYYGLAIGFVVVAGGYGAGHISGGCFNPAVALGIDVSSFGLGFGYSIAYLCFEFIGAAMAAGLYKVVRTEEEGKQLMAKLVSEFLGTFMLVLTVGLNVLGGSKAPVFSIAASLMCMIYALGSVSGANFNPAVTLCLLITNRPSVLDRKTGLFYMIVQLAAGIAAGFTYMFMEAGKTFPLGPGTRYTMGQAAFAEIVFTFLLCYVVCSVATVQKDKALTQYFGLAIGSCVTAGGYAIGAVSGGSLNPAVSFGIAVSKMEMASVGNAFLYTIFEFIGAAIAGCVFMMVTHTTDDSFKDDKLSA